MDFERQIKSSYPKIFLFCIFAFFGQLANSQNSESSPSLKEHPQIDAETLKQLNLMRARNQQQLQKIKEQNASQSKVQSRKEVIPKRNEIKTTQDKSDGRVIGDNSLNQDMFGSQAYELEKLAGQKQLDQALRMLEKSQFAGLLKLGQKSSDGQSKSLWESKLEKLDTFKELHSEMLEQFTHKNPFSHIPPSMMEKMILERMKSYPRAYEIVSQNPRLLEFVSLWATDERALPSFFSILKKQKQLKIYGLTTLIVMVLCFLISRVLTRYDFFWRRLFKRIYFNLFGSSVSLLCFYSLFRQELGPSLQLAKDFWMGG